MRLFKLFGVILVFLVVSCAPAASGGPTPSTGGSTPSTGGSTPSTGDSKAPAAGAPIKIVSLNSTTGSLSFSGYRGHQGAQMAVDEINKAGGVLGRPFELTIMDDKTDPQEGVKLYREAVANGVVASIGPFASAVAPAVSQAARELKTPVLLPGAWTRSFVEEFGHRYLFRIATNDRVFAGATAEEASKKGYKRFCTIGFDFAYGRDITANTINALKKLNPDTTVISGCEFWPKLGDTDFTPYITAMMSQKPDAVMYGGLVAEGVTAFMKQSGQFGLFKTAGAVHPSLGMPLNNWGLTKEVIIEGAIAGGGYPYPIIDTPANKQFYDQFRARFTNEYPMETTVESYYAVKTLAKAIQKAGTVDKEKIVDALEGITVDLLTGPTVTIRKFDHQSDQGWFMGELTWDDQLGHAALKNVHYVKADPYLPSEEEIQRLRTQSAPPKK